MSGHAFNSDSDAPIEHLGRYHKYWLNKAANERNPKFDDFSTDILNLKHKDNDFKRQRSVDRFAKDLEKQLPAGAVITVVPSHDPQSTDSGLRDLAKKLAGRNRTNGTACLVRTRKIDKLAGGANRSLQIHLNTISVQHAELIKGKDVILIDDVTTTGNSLQACRQLLLNAGAKSVRMIAIGRTVDE